MSLLDDILSWAGSELVPWQRDAMRRLFQKGALDPNDYDDLYAMLKSAHGLPDSSSRVPDPLEKKHLPSSTTGTKPPVLVTMRDLENVNRIAPSQRLEFSQTGLTVVYGGNGSGKSGYSRVLKRACRARDLTETIHPDAFDPASSSKIPQATFDMKLESGDVSVIWKRDTPAPEELATVAVFDGRCARAYLDLEQDVAYLPYGLDTVEGLAQKVIPELTQRLNSEIASLNTDTGALVDLLGETAVGRAIASLSHTTDPASLSALGTLTEIELTRLAELDKVLAEPDPKAKATAMRLSAQRIQQLTSRIDSAVATVDDQAIKLLQSVDDEAESAIRAEGLAATELQAGEPLLPGTGEHAWKILFEAARKFSTENAYPTQAFPNIDSGAQCVLCQQPYDPNAAKRMSRFGEFVKEDVAKTAVTKKLARGDALKKLDAASTSAGLDAALTQEVNSLDDTLIPRVQKMQSDLEARKLWSQKAFISHEWTGAPAIQDDPRPTLKAFATKQISQAADHEKASDENLKKALQKEQAELRTRVALSKRLLPVLQLHQNMQHKAKLTKCKDDLKTRPISDKAKDFASLAVTSTLKRALDDEFKALEVKHIKTQLKERVDQGKMKHKLILDMPVTRKLDEILSEGEQRVIAIASFLAELKLAKHGGAIVFDDPVSSLDHHFRRTVATRLIREAKSRQVAIFTHDTIFLGDLQELAEQESVAHTVHHLQWDGKAHPGLISTGLPWEHQSYKERIDTLEKKQKILEKTWPPYPSDSDRAAMRQTYSEFRATVERVIQDVVFNGVVKRYREWIQVGNLKEVVGFDDVESAEIARLHKAACDVTEAHDPASGKNASVPDAQKLLQDIDALKGVVDRIKNRRKARSNSQAQQAAP